MAKSMQGAAELCVVLLSGGLDSAVVLACARREGREVHALSIDYGQRHRHELEASGRVARALGAASHVTLGLDLRAIGGSALTSDGLSVPKHGAGEVAGRGGIGGSGGIPVTYVPARNLTFLSLSLGHAEVLGAREIWIGVNRVDYSGYPDCRPEFVRAFEATANLATRAGVERMASGAGGPAFVVRTPLIDLTKAEIIRLGGQLGVDFSLTHSCYDPVRLGGGGIGACGACDSCVIRRRGFVEAGVGDPTRYA